jgi:hypothetical protein
MRGRRHPTSAPPVAHVTTSGRWPPGGGALLGALFTFTAVVAGCSSAGESNTTPAASVVSAVTTPAVVTDAPTTTQPPNAATPLVRQAVLDLWAASRSCGQRPKRCRPDSFTASQGALRADVLG